MQGRESEIVLTTESRAGACECESRPRACYVDPDAPAARVAALGHACRVARVPWHDWPRVKQALGFAGARWVAVLVKGPDGHQVEFVELFADFPAAGTRCRAVGPVEAQRLVRTWANLRRPDEVAEGGW